MKYMEIEGLVERDLGYRRIQCTGRGSYVISLPKEWVLNLGLEKGSQIAFRVLEDSSLLLTPRSILEGRRKAEERSLRRYCLIVDARDDPKSICRKIISLYVISAELIRVRFREGYSSKFRLPIKNLVKNMLLGSEIIEETPEGMTIQILINHPVFPVEKAIRRMAILALSADRDSIIALKDMDEELIESVIDSCSDVNRLNLYVLRQLKYYLERNLYKELGFKTPKEFLGYRIVANNIKSIADNAVNIARNVKNLKRLIEGQVLFLKEVLDEEVYSQILEFNNFAHQLFEDSMKALFKRNYNLADSIISKIEGSIGIENDLTGLISSKRLDPNISSIMRLILDNSRRIMEYSRDIAEVTLNRSIEEVVIPEAR